MTKDNNPDNKKYKNNNEEEFYAYVIPIGLGIGVVWGIVFDQLIIGIAIGASLGVVFSTLFKNKKDKNNKN